MLALRPLFPLLIAAGILLGGNGLFSTLIAIRGAQEGMSPSLIGWMGTTYYVGFLIGCLMVPELLRRVGHVRTFAALASLAATATLMMILYVDAWHWMAQRFVTGICFSGLFTTIESWLNSSVSNQQRGKVTGVYRVIDILVVSGAQFMMPVFGTEGFVLFAIMALMITFSLIPVAIGDRSNPKPPEHVRFNLREIWVISPLACLGCIAIGMTNSAFRFVGPLYAQDVGLSLASVATFISLGVVGGAVLQYPLGWLSDRYDRRWVLIGATLGAVLGGAYISLLAGSDPLLIYIGIFVFGAFSLPLYSLAAAHANDRASSEQYVLLAAGLMFFYGVGAMVGPPVSSAMVQWFGPSYLFAFTSITHGLLAIATLWRMRIRESVPQDQRGQFRALLRTSPQMQTLDGGADKDIPAGKSSEPGK
ncbi:MAG: MFS transporter [Ahrensia sp.]|nr:MFS transporter [Ahrensia sp.]